MSLSGRKTRSTILWDEARQAIPHTVEGKIDRAACRTVYDASKHIEWVPFCHSIGWNTFHTRMRLPVTEWVAEKKQRIESEISARLSELATTYQKEWIADVKNTLGQYPSAVDNAMELIEKYILAIDRGEMTAKASDLMALAAAIKTCVEAKKSLLMLNDVVVKMQSQHPTNDEDQSNSWTMTLRGEKEITPKKLAELMSRYLDRPQSAADELGSENLDCEH